MDITKEQFLDWLFSWNACEEGITFVQKHLSQDIKTIIISLPDIGWMIWFLYRLDLDLLVEKNIGFKAYYEIVTFEDDLKCDFLEVGEYLWYSGIEVTKKLKKEGFEFPWNADVEEALKNKIGE